MTQKREIWQPSCLGYLASLSLHVFRNMHVSTYQKISLHLPSFWGKIVLFKASCQKTSLSSWIIRLLFLPLSTLFFRCWTEVFLTFLLLLVSGDRTALGEGFPILVPLLSLLRYRKNYSSCPSQPPVTPLTHFSERRWWEDMMGQRSSSCSDGHGQKLAVPFASSLLGPRNLNTGKSSRLFWQWKAPSKRQLPRDPTCGTYNSGTQGRVGSEDGDGTEIFTKY